MLFQELLRFYSLKYAFSGFKNFFACGALITNFLGAMPPNERHLFHTEKMAKFEKNAINAIEKI